jgi:hypothetical protein
MKAIFFKKNNVFPNQAYIANFIEKIGNLFENWCFDISIELSRNKISNRGKLKPKNEG